MLDNVLSETTLPPPKSFLARAMAHPLWLSLSADIFTGQMIASLIVLTFIAVFLLREWISQNARPGMFEEEALPDEPPPAQPPLNPPPVPLQQHQVLMQQHQAIAQPQPQHPILEPLPQRQVDTIQPINAPHIQRDKPIDIDPDRWLTTRTPPIQDKRQRKKSRARHSETNGNRHSSHRARSLDPEDDASPQERALIKRKMFHRRIHVARTTSARRRVFTPLHKSSSSAPLAVPEQKAKFNFTFKAPSAPLAPGESSSAVQCSVASDANNNPQSSPFPSVALQPPTADIPFSLRRWQQTAPNGSRSSISQPYPPRPPLPTATLPLPSSGSNSPFIFSAGRSPTDSSSLATYRPPEDLQAEAGPSNLSGHLNQRKEDFNDEVEQNFGAVGKESEEEYTFGRLGPEHGRYFRDPDDTGSDSEEAEEMPSRPRLQELMDSDSEEDIEGENVNDQPQPGQREGLADDEEDEEDDDGVIHEGEDEDEEPDAGEELFDQWDENEAEVEAMGPLNVPLGVAAGAPVLADNQVAPVPAGAAVADNDEAEGNVEDDMEGALEG